MSSDRAEQIQAYEDVVKELSSSSKPQDINHKDYLINWEDNRLLRVKTRLNKYQLELTWSNGVIIFPGKTS